MALLIPAGCALEAPPVDEPGARFEVAVAPLTLPGVGKTYCDLPLSDGATSGDPSVWAKGTPGLNGGSGDPDALCSTNFGNGEGGDITFVGLCGEPPRRWSDVSNQ